MFRRSRLLAVATLPRADRDRGGEGPGPQAGGSGRAGLPAASRRRALPGAARSSRPRCGTSSGVLRSPGRRPQPGPLACFGARGEASRRGCSSSTAAPVACSGCVADRRRSRVRGSRCRGGPGHRPGDRPARQASATGACRDRQRDAAVASARSATARGDRHAGAASGDFGRGRWNGGLGCRGRRGGGEQCAADRPTDAGKPGSRCGPGRAARAGRGGARACARCGPAAATSRRGSQARRCRGRAGGRGHAGAA